MGLVRVIEEPYELIQRPLTTSYDFVGWHVMPTLSHSHPYPRDLHIGIA